VAVLFVNASASENPFALKENLLKIDSDQEMLLSELSKIAEAREDAELEDNEMDAELEKEANAKEAPSREEKADGKVSVAVDTELDAEDAAMNAELVAEAKKHGLPLAELEKEEELADLANSIDEIVGDYDKDAGKQLAATLEGIEDNAQKEDPVPTAISDEAEKRASAQKAKKEFEAALKIAQEKEAQEKADTEKAEQVQVQKEADEKRNWQKIHVKQKDVKWKHMRSKEQTNLPKKLRLKQSRKKSWQKTRRPPV